MTTKTVHNFTELGRIVVKTEARAIQQLENRINQQFTQACELLLTCQGRIVVLGMGKSGHIANKIAATLASTGTPAFFVHPGEACHGDMGMITQKDVVLALSNSGNTTEIVNLLPVIKRFGIPLVSLTGKSQSTLAKLATVNLDTSVEEEACPLGLAPTSSTTAMLVMGDALAIALLEARGFTSDDFATFHPGGLLGRRLLLRVSDIMHDGNELPKVTELCLLDQALVEMTEKSLGMTTVVDPQGKLLGIFTDGDLRRTLDQNYDLHSTAIKQVMTRNGISVTPDLLAVDTLTLMQAHKITSIPVIDEYKHAIGVVHMHDLLRAGVI